MKRFAFIICFLLLPFAVAVAQEVNVFAQVDNNRTVYVGERFPFYIVIDGGQQAGDVDLSPLSAYSPISTGNRDMSSSSITIRNGKRTERVVKRFVMTYSLLASEKGTINLPGVDVTVAGKKYKTQPQSVKVVEPSRSEKLQLELSLSKEKCYVGQPVEISLKWFIHAEVVNKYEVRAVSFLSPIFSSDDFHIERVINEPRALNDRKNFVSFEINDRKVPFYQRTVKRQSANWVELSYSAVFVPKHPGNITIKPARVLTDIAEPSSLFGRTNPGQRYSAVSKTAQLEVIPLPDMNRPKEAYGLVGNYTISASATPTTVDVGQPITLTVRIGGSKLLKNVRRPDIENIEVFNENFRLSPQRDDPVIEDGQKVFKMTIRASNDSVTEIPAIPLVFFDTDKGKYVTEKSNPIPLKVNPSDVFTSSDIEFTGKGNISSQVEAVKKGIAANVVDIDLINQEFTLMGAMLTPGYLALWGLPFVLLVVSAVARPMTSKSDAKVASSKRRKAKSNAQAMLNAAKTKQDLVAAMRQYVGWRFNKSAGALTGTDCERIITEATGDTDAAREYRTILDKCEAAQYTGAGGTCERDEISNIINIISRVDKKS